MVVLSIFKGGLARLLFAVHGTIIIWKVNQIYTSTQAVTLPWIEDSGTTSPPTYAFPIYYLLLLPICLLPIEFILTISCTKTGEWKWWCPSVFLYLTSVIPGLWMLQLHLYNQRIETRDLLGWETCQVTTNYSTTSLEDIQGISTGLGFEFSDDAWALALEQILIVLLILGRWLLPKGSLTRDQLSQLLLVYIGMAADILEFNVENLKEEAVFCDLPLIIIILTMWSWSLMQFTLVLTAVSGRRGRNFARSRPKRFCQLCCLCGCWTNELWSMLLTLSMQDIPFVVMRFYLLIGRQAVNQMMIFFTAKNVLVISLQFYRMGIICCGDTDLVEPEPESGAGKQNSADEADAMRIAPADPEKGADGQLVSVRPEKDTNRNAPAGTEMVLNAEEVVS